MIDFLYYFLLGFFGVYLAVKVLESVRGKVGVQSYAPAVDSLSQQPEPQKRPNAPTWLRSFAINPDSVTRIVVIDRDCVSWDESDQEIRDMTSQCFELGNCRGPDFARFAAGGALASGMRLVFASVIEYDGQKQWYGFVAPLKWASEVGSG